MEGTNIKTGFAWKPEDNLETKRVELLISKAEGIYEDHFENNDVQFDLEGDKLSTYNLEQWNADGAIFGICVSLEPGVYHFIFRVDSGSKEELKTSEYYDRTHLGNGRAVNYIELKSPIGTQKVESVKTKKRQRSSESMSQSINRSKSESWNGTSSVSDGSIQTNSHHKSCTLL